MATDKQIAANRANAQKSTGPKTPEGKLISSLNNTRHGMLAKSLLIRGESPERFRAMLATYYLHFKPLNAAENALVDILAAARWRQMRLTAVETEAINLEIDRQAPADAVHNAPARAHLALRALAADSGYSNLMHRAITRADREFSLALEKLLRLKREAEKTDPDRLQPPGWIDNPEPDFSSGFDGTNPIPAPIPAEDVQ